jgi:hypothetical protein
VTSNKEGPEDLEVQRMEKKCETKEGRRGIKKGKEIKVRKISVSCKL